MSEPADEKQPVTFINVFEIPAEHVDAFVAGWQERADIMRTMPGFRDTRLHRALSSEARFQVINVAHWDSREDWEAATASPEFQAQIRAVTEGSHAPISASPALYEVVVDHSGQS